MKKLIILGGGESGVGAAILGKKAGYEIFLSDQGKIKDVYIKELDQLGVEYEQEKHTEERILKAEEVVKSPGIPDKAELIQKIRRAGIPVISEIEFAGRHTTSKIIAITGSNGKTTTTSLTHHLLKTAHIDAGMAGNVGYSFARLVAESNKLVYALELSSFQLDGIENFRPDVSVLLNITPDHLDRYDHRMESYARSKFRIMMNQKENDLFIYNKDSAAIADFLRHRRLRMQKLAVSEKYCKDGVLRTQQGAVLSMAKSALKGPHNWLNALCAVEAAMAMGASPDLIQKGLNTFVNAAHRLEMVAKIKGVEYFNDSKATNVDSVFWALKAMTKPVVLILGGQDKGNDYEQIAQLTKEKVKAIVCLGVDNEKIKTFFSAILDEIIETRSAAEAVRSASKFAQSGDAVLLSPACASFDLFKNYEDRGDQFKAAVKALQVKTAL